MKEEKHGPLKTNKQTIKKKTTETISEKNQMHDQLVLKTTSLKMHQELMEDVRMLTLKMICEQN